MSEDACSNRSVALVGAATDLGIRRDDAHQVAGSPSRQPFVNAVVRGAFVDNEQTHAVVSEHALGNVAVFIEAHDNGADNIAHAEASQC